MKNLKLIAAAVLAALSLSACVGFVVPIPLAGEPSETRERR